MALHVALNRTPKSEDKQQVCEDAPIDFTAATMRQMQEAQSNCLCSLNDIKEEINKILFDIANSTTVNVCTVFFTTAHLNGVHSIVVKDFDKQDLETVAAWLRNNGYYTDINWFDTPHGSMLGSLLIYWQKGNCYVLLWNY